MTDRFAVCEAYAVLSWDFGLYGIWSRLQQMGFRPSPMLSRETLHTSPEREEALRLYVRLKPRARRTGPWDRRLTK